MGERILTVSNGFFARSQSGFVLDLEHVARFPLEISTAYVPRIRIRRQAYAGIYVCIYIIHMQVYIYIHACIHISWPIL